MWQEQATNTEKGGGICRLGKCHSCTFVCHSLLCLHFSKFVPVMERLFIICIVLRAESLQLCRRQSCIPNYTFIWLCCFRVSKDPEGACVPAVTCRDSLQLGRKNSLFLGFLTMSLSAGPWRRSEHANWLAFSVSGKAKHTVSFWFTLTPSLRLDTKTSLYWLTYKVEPLVTRLKAKGCK